MTQAAFAYADNGHANGAGSGAAGVGRVDLAASLSIFADRAHLRGEMRDDAAVAGLRVVAEAELGTLIGEGADAGGCAPVRPLGDVVLVDCPVVDAAGMAALSRLDLRAAHGGARLIVSTTVGAIDDVFACMDRSDPQFLVDPTRAERVVALGEAPARLSTARVRELTEEDRLAVLRLTEQVGQIAQRLDRLAGADKDAEIAPNRDNLFRFDPRPWRDAEAVRATQPAWRDGEACVGGKRGRVPDHALLPDPQLVRRIIRQRQLRGRFLDPELFADPAWDMLLDLTAAAAEKVRVSVSSLCIAASVPPTTALRWIRQMTEAGLLARIDDDQDRRRAFITLTERSRAAMTSYFRELGEVGAAAV